MYQLFIWGGTKWFSGGGLSVTRGIFGGGGGGGGDTYGGMHP